MRIIYNFGGVNLFKENLKKYYDMEADLRNQYEMEEWKTKIRENFIYLVQSENKKNLLEIGAGAGFDSQFFISKGLNVVAIDLSSEMVKKCKEKNIQAYEMDFYNLSGLNEKFDCVWAMNSLVHVPKTDLAKVLNEIWTVLKPNGLFYMGVWGGVDFEKEYVKADVSNTPRFFSYYSENNIKAVLKNHFQIDSFEQSEVTKNDGKDIFQSIVMRKI
jgi:SAM-dependent methyltransferase